MVPGCEIPESNLAQLREACSADPCLAAIYVFGRQRTGDCDLAALFTKTLSWSARLDLELAVAEAMEQEGVELIDLRRMPLVFRFGVVDEGEPIYVGQPSPAMRPSIPFLRRSIGKWRPDRYPRTCWTTHSMPHPALADQR